MKFDLTIIIVSLIVFFIVRTIAGLIKGNYLKGGNIKANAKDGSIEATFNNAILDSCYEGRKLSHLQGKTNKEVVEYYKNKELLSYITEMDTYKEYHSIIGSATLNIFFQLEQYVIQNHILQKDESEFGLYVKQRSKELLEIYNTALLNSSNETIKKLTVKKICGYHYFSLLTLIRDCYVNIYDNHKKVIESRSNEIKELMVVKKQLDNNSIGELSNIIEESLIKSQNVDFSIVKNTYDDLMSLLCGLFHDTIRNELIKKGVSYV